jgi:hypothetical protein
MTNVGTTSRKFKTYIVSYSLDEGFLITVKAASAENAERIVRKRLDEFSAELPGSERVHYDDCVNGADEVQP